MLDMIDKSRRTILIEFKSRLKYTKFLRTIDRGVLKEYIDEHSHNTIWLTFPDDEFRDIMMKTLKDTVPKYKIRLSVGQQEQIII